MSVLPSQKLTIGELYVSMAVGLILYLLPGDIRNQMNSMVISEIMVFISTLTITAVFFFIIKRYEAIGAALLTNSIITAGAFGFGIIHGIQPYLNVYNMDRSVPFCRCSAHIFP